MANRSTIDLRISNYKSVASLEIKGLRPFSVFAGPNGSGKSNFFDALDFVGMVCRYDVESALRAHGGAINIRSAKLYAPKNQRLEFRMDLQEASGESGKRDQASSYTLGIRDLGTAPKVEESLSDLGRERFKRHASDEVSVSNPRQPASMLRLRDTMSAVAFFPQHPLTNLLTNIVAYRVDPRSAKEPDRSDADPSELNAKGSNLAAVLSRIEAESEDRQLIEEWIEMVVPGVQAITTKRQQLDQTTAVLFKERGTKKLFPAGLMSDGTVYALSLLVAVLDRRDSPGITLIEEPERGLHPAAIADFVELLRDSAGPKNPIWVTTHSESVVRKLRLEELILVDKVHGRTKMKRADSGNLEDADLKPLGLDVAWLSNLLNGGVPW